MEKRLTEYSACGGCASKLAAGELARMLGDIPLIDDDRVLVDYRTADDAGVYKWPGGPALVQTVDFFTPVVDDPYAYGKIAAANALSDVYAMGGVPRTALAIAALPDAGPGADVIKRIFRGGFDTLREAGVALLGGHTVRDQEIKFGYAITGEIDPARVLTNAGARVGDVLILTKALGTGIINTAVKFNRATEAQAASAIASMCQLNRASAEILRALPPQVISACTDVTGFSLVGHASEMAAGSHVTLEIRAEHVPLLEGAAALAEKNLPGGGRTNQDHFGQRANFGPNVGQALRLVMFDPQTSGGLLIAVSPGEAADLLGQLRQSGAPAAEIGHVRAADPSGILVHIK